MKQMLVLFILIFTCDSFAQSVYPAACDDNELLSNYNTILHRFSFKSECKKALEESRTAKGKFCDGDKLYWPNGFEFHDFNWSSDCQAALEQFRTSPTGLFCDGTAMFQVNSAFLTYHTFDFHCTDALNDARDHRGFFCKDSQMFDQWGRYIRDYSFRSSCREALRKITF